MLQAKSRNFLQNVRMFDVEPANEAWTREETGSGVKLSSGQDLHLVKQVITAPRNPRSDD